jgi:hypothetical protein
MQYVGYVYNVETNEVAAEIIGEMRKIESYVNDNYDNDIFGLTFTPAFGVNDGLINTGHHDIIYIEDFEGRE